MITTIPYGHSTSYVKIPNFIFIYVVSIQVLFYSFFRIPMCLSPFQMTPACLSTLTPIQHTHLFRGNALTPRLWQLKPAKPPKAEGESTQGDSRPQSNWVTHLEKTHVGQYDIWKTIRTGQWLAWLSRLTLLQPAGKTNTPLNIERLICYKSTSLYNSIIRAAVLQHTSGSAHPHLSSTRPGAGDSGSNPGCTLTRYLTSSLSLLIWHLIFDTK